MLIDMVRMCYFYLVFRYMIDDETWRYSIYIKYNIDKIVIIIIMVWCVTTILMIVC